MENIKINFSSSDYVLGKLNEEDGEKENVNVVIVPESILQAIKNSSNLDMNPASSYCVGHQKDEQKTTSEISENHSNVSSTANPVMWIALPINNDTLSPTVSQNGANTISNEVEIQTSDVMSSIETDSCKEDMQECAPAKSGSTTQIIVIPNSNVMPTSLPDESSGTDVATESAPKFYMQNTSNGLYLTMCVQSVENDGEKSIYTLAPAHDVDDSGQQSNPASANTSMECDVPSTSSAVNTTAATQSGSKMPSFLSSPPIISHQQTINQVSTANKGTYACGSKPLHQCDVDGCNEVFKSALQCRKHKTVMHEKEKPYKCKYANCMWSFKTPYKLNRHLESHYQRKPYVCPFPGCGVTFSNDYNQRAHLKLHTALRSCEICGEMTANKRKLSSHMRIVHNNGPEFTCNICNKNCHTKAALVVHKRTHNPQMMYDCPLCDKKFARRSYLKLHIFTHTGEKPFQCDQCDWGFASISRLNRHMKTHKEKKFKCSHKGCDKEFHRLHHLFQHLRVKHPGEESSDDADLQAYLNEATGGDQPYFTCEACSLDFLSSHGLERHKLSCKQSMVSSSTVSERHNGNTKNTTTVQVCETSSIEDQFQKNICENAPVEDASLKNILTDQEANAKLGCSSSAAAPLVQLTNSNNVIMLTDTWTTAYSADNLPEAASDSHYLACHPHEPGSQISLVPFMDDMGVLNDAATEQFLRLDGDMSTCVDTVSVSVDSSGSEQADSSDVLQRYVVGPNKVDRSSQISKDLGLRQDPYSQKKSGREEEVETTTLFDGDIPLVSIDDGRNPHSSTHFSGTTININDIH